MAAPPTLPRVELRGISKRFGSVVANDNVDLVIRSGEIHALVGENGAGKSTIVKILCGLEHADAGELRLDGVPTVLGSPLDAVRAGIGAIHQQPMIFPDLTAAENVVLGLPIPNGRIPRAHDLVRPLAERYGVEIDYEARMGGLSAGQQKRVELLRALACGARVLVLDEPTATLSRHEIGLIREQLTGIASSGAAVLYVSHNVDEVLAVAHRITVMRRGRVVHRAATGETSAAEVARAIVGAELGSLPIAGAAPSTDAALQLEEVTVPGDRGRIAVHDLDLTVHAGEIVVLGGSPGNGQAELVEAILGLRRLEGGRIHVRDRDVSALSPRGRRGLGIGYVPEEVRQDALASGATVEENAIMGRHRARPLARNGFLRGNAVAEYAKRLIRDLDVRTPSTKLRVDALSGGNAQRLCIARELRAAEVLLVAVEPTHGLDLAATEFVRSQILTRRSAGVGVLLVTCELSEIEVLADRAFVMGRGRLGPQLASRSHVRGSALPARASDA